MSNKLDVQIVLDRSGSMANAWDDTLGGLNQYVSTLAKDKEVDATITLTVFDTGSIDTIRSTVSAKKFEKVTDKEVHPRGGTPLFDAVGQSINAMRDRLPRHRKALVVMTDGHENSSQEHTVASIKALIERCQKDDWLVTYLGADHDAWDQASSMGFGAAHVGQYSKKRTRAAFDIMAGNMALYSVRGTAASAAYTEAQRSEMMGDDDNQSPN